MEKIDEVKIYVTDIEKETLENPYYRRVLFTTPHMQLVVMKLYPGEDIPMEVHQGTQFVRIEEGIALVQIENTKFYLRDNEIIMIPAGTRHYFRNDGTGPLSIYTIYSPPEHSPTEIEYEQV